MDCKHVNEHLVEYLYQELDADQLDRMEGHLKQCEGCAGELAAFESTRKMMRQLPDLEPPSMVSRKLMREAMQAVQPDEVSLWDRLRAGLRVLVMHPAMTAAVALVLVLGVSFYAYRYSSGPARDDLEPAPALAPAAPAPGGPGVVAEKREQAAPAPPATPAPATAQDEDTTRAKLAAAPEPTRAAKPAARPRPRARRVRGAVTRKARRPARVAPGKHTLDLEQSMAAEAKGKPADRKEDDQQSPKSLLARAELATKKGDCATALSYYDKALRSAPKLRKVVAPMVQRCMGVLGRGGEGRLFKAQKMYPYLAGFAEAEIARAREERAQEANPPVKAAPPVKSAPAKPAAVPTAD